MSGDFLKGQFQVLPLNKTDKARRGIRWADVNGDGRPDLLVAEPESGQISIYFQEADGSLSAPKTFPTLAGISDRLERLERLARTQNGTEGTNGTKGSD